MGLTYNDLKKIIKGFAENGKIFSNEAQFQFSLAQAIKNFFKDVNCEVLFEHLILIKDEKDDYKSEDDEKRIKMYVDLIIKIENKYYPIELKYKTADKDITYRNQEDESCLYTFNQGAVDTGSYDFIKDIHRLELLVVGKDAIGDYDLIIDKNNQYDKIENPIFDCTSLGKVEFEKGFAIIITNDDKYFNKDKKTKKNKNEEYYWKNFFLTKKDDEKKAQICGNLYWTNKTDGTSIEINDEDIISNYKNYIENVKTNAFKNCSKEYLKPICLKGCYDIDWQPYKVEGYIEKLNSPRCKQHSFYEELSGNYVEVADVQLPTLISVNTNYEIGLAFGDKSARSI